MGQQASLDRRHLLATAMSAWHSVTVMVEHEANKEGRKVGRLYRAVQSVVLCDSSRVVAIVGKNVPFGRAKTPLSEPFVRAWLKRELNWVGVVDPRSLFAWTYFLRA